jgi:basic membrane protein A
MRGLDQPIAFRRLCRLLRCATLPILACLTGLAAACSPLPAGPAPTAAAPTPIAATKPTAASSGAPTTPSAASASNTCKVGQVYGSPTAEKGWSWAHEQSLLAAALQELPGTDLSTRMDSVPDGNKQAVEDLIENMVQQGANVVYTTSAGFAEPTRAVAARHLNVFFFNAGGAPGRNDPANISYYYATIEEARYITGELAGLVVEPGANIGYVASQPTPDVFRGENAFALGVMKTNPAAKIYNKWTLARFDPNAERQAAQSLLEAPIKAALLSQHQDSPTIQLAAQDAGRFAIGYGFDMGDSAPKASLTSAVWNWTEYYKYTLKPSCPGGGWVLAGKANPPPCCKYWMGSFKDGTVQVAPLNVSALVAHPRKFDIWQLYDDEVAAFSAGRKSFESIFTGPIKDNQGEVRIAGKPDIGALYDERGQWFVENVVGSPNP